MQTHYPISGADIIKAFRNLAATGKTHYKDREKRIGYSDPHIRTMCKFYFGQTSGEVFNDIKLDIFRDFIIHSNWSIEEICFWFNTSYRHMNVVYQKQFGEKMSVTRHRANVVIYKTRERAPTNRFNIDASSLYTILEESVTKGIWKVAEVARIMGCSTVTLQQKSKILLGRDISHVIHDLRAEMIRDCIMNSNLSVYDIALLMGCERRALSEIYFAKYGEQINETRTRYNTLPKVKKGVNGGKITAIRYRAA